MSWSTPSARVAPEAIEMSRGPSGRARRPNPKRWRVLMTEANIVVIDERAVPPDGDSEEGSEQTFILNIVRRTGVATESMSTVSEALLSLTSTDSSASPPGGNAQIREVRAFAILGMVPVESAWGLLLVTEADCICEMDGKPIYEVAAVERIPISHAGGSSSESATALGEGMLKLLNDRGFYFAQDIDITHSLQYKKRLTQEARRRRADPISRLPDGSALDLIACASPRFVWNRRLVDQFTRQGVSTRWFVPLMQGHIQVAQRSEPLLDAPGWELQLTLLLISRRGSGRAGTRYNARGLDDNGEVANLIETEQLARFKLALACSDEEPTQKPEGCPHGWLSFVQVRGSVPLFWEQSFQSLQLTRAPALAAPAFELHQRSTREAYEGDVFYVNLLSDSKPEEKVLTEALEHQLRKATTGAGDSCHQPHGSNMDLYYHFDFHAMVHGASQCDFDEEMEALLKKLYPFLERSGFLDATTNNPEAAKPEPRKWQTGVLRTNCLDCLDRTNVVQFYVVWAWLRGYCAKHKMLNVLLEPKPLPEILAKETTLAAFQQAGSSLLDGAAALQKAGATFFDGIFGGSSNTSVPISTADHTGEILKDGATSDVAPLAPPILRQLLQELWADHGDRVSLQYTGTASIMSSVLREGQNTSFAMLERSWQGLNRAYQASFQDSSRQEWIDVLLGQHRSTVDVPALRPPQTRRAAATGNAMDAAPRAQIGLLTTWVGTWNLQGKEGAWSEESGLRPWLGPCASDVVVFCLQELIELSPTNIVLNGQGDDARSERFEQAAQHALASFGRAYVKVRAIGMVGLFCVAFVRESLAPLIKDVRVDRVKSGVYGSAGNKGTVAVRFEIFATTFCFLCVHFESGQDKVEQRCAQLRDSLKCFDGGNPPIPTAIDHDVFALAGDLNVRLNLPAGMAADQLHRSLDGCLVQDNSDDVNEPVWQSLLQYDQLLAGFGQQLKPVAVVEGPIKFPPTYKILRGKDAYDTGRTPAWCDRVLYKSVGSRLTAYTAVNELKGSDHRPVYATMEATLLGRGEDKERFEALNLTSADCADNRGVSIQPNPVTAVKVVRKAKVLC